MGEVNPVPDLESTYALPVFIESLVEGALAFPRRFAGICDSMRLIAFRWAKVEQTKECGIREKPHKFLVFNGLAG